MIYKKIIFFFLCFNGFSLFAQKNNANLNYNIKKANSPIKIDGQNTEDAWQNAISVSDFRRVLPMDTGQAAVKTEVKLTYDKKNLYILFINYNFIKGPNVVESMKRDWNFGKNDNDLIFFDTFNDLTNGFAFGSNARGGQWDALVYNGGNANLAWDNKWKSEASFDTDKWTWEAAIPFKTLRYSKNKDTWGLNLSRLDLKTTEKSAWAPVPRQFPTASLAYTGNLVWDNPPPKPGTNISLIPFLYYSRINKFVPNAKPENNFGYGFDAKIALNSSLNLDLTVLPDFSQVEVDVQQTNLDRFELFFPERRQFFLENGDIFNNFGTANVRPFFSRRVGLNAPLLFGAKFSGKIDKNWRIGAMNMQTGNTAEFGAGSNYSVFSVQRQIQKRSYLGFIYTDKNLNNAVEAKPTQTLFNRTFGLEYNLASADNKWQGKTAWIKTFSPTAKKDNNAYTFNIGRFTKKYTADIDAEMVDESVTGNEVGFIRRTNYMRVNPGLVYQFFTKGGKLLSHGPRIFSNLYFSRTGFNLTENTNGIFYRFLFRKQESASIWVANDYVKLLSPFDPTGYVGEKLATNQEHRWRAWGTSFASRPQSLFTYGFDTRYGGYYASGKRLRLDAETAIRFQPYATLGIKGSYNRLQFFEDKRLTEKLKNSTHNLLLIGPRLDLSFTNKIFFTSFAQYNNQANNFNINSRFQWRYSPASDLFLVYTENYTADSFNTKDRALVLKFTYWWNI